MEWPKRFTAQFVRALEERDDPELTKAFLIEKERRNEERRLRKKEYNAKRWKEFYSNPENQKLYSEKQRQKYAKKLAKRLDKLVSQ